MGFRVAIIGYGAVASVHARQLAGEAGVSLASVWGPDKSKAERFTSQFGGAQPADSLEQAIERADAAIIASPSTLHVEQARACLQRGIPALVELPPCDTEADWRALAQLAAGRGTRVACAHTSRYLAPYVLIRDAIRGGIMGTVQQVDYIRHHRLRERTWTDSALLHHAAHPVDLLIEWCGSILPLACIAVPTVEHAQSSSLLAKLPGGAPAAISVTYASRLPHVRMLVVGSLHTVETDGFSYLRSDLESLSFQGGEQDVYEKAIHDQDMEFIRACRGEEAGVAVQETLKLLRAMEGFASLAATRHMEGII